MEFDIASRAATQPASGALRAGAQHVLHGAVSYCQQFTVHAGKRDFIQAVRKVRPALVTSALQRYVQIAWTAGHPAGSANVATGIGYTLMNLSVQNIAVSAPVLLKLSITKLVSSDIVCAKPRADWSKSVEKTAKILSNLQSQVRLSPPPIFTKLTNFKPQYVEIFIFES